MSISMDNLSADYNAKTVVRALQSANVYLDKNMATNAQRDLDRALNYLNKVPATDLPVLQEWLVRLSDHCRQAQEEEQTQRVLQQLERQVRYAQEAVDKNNAYDVQRYLDQARREIQKLPEESPLRSQQETVLDGLAAQSALIQERAKAASTIRQLEREMRSARDTVQRSGGSMSMESLEPYLNKCRKTMEKLPASLQPEWQDKLDALVEEAPGIAAKKRESLSQPATKNVSPSPPASPPAKKDISTRSGLSPTSVVAKQEGSAPSSPSPTAQELDAGTKRLLDRSIRSIQESLDRNEPDRAANALHRARSDLERKQQQVPDPHYTQYTNQLDKLDKQIVVLQQRHQADRLLDACRRGFDRIQNMLDDTRSHSQAIADCVNDELGRLNRLIETDFEERGTVLSDDERADLHTRMEAFQVAGQQAVEAYIAKETTKYLDRYEECVRDESRDRLQIEAYQRNATEAVDRIPECFDGSGLLQGRLAELDQIRASRYAKEDKTQTIRNIETYWSGTKSNQAHALENFELEEGNGYEEWRASNKLGVDLSETVAHSTSSFLATEQVAAAIQAGLRDEIAYVLEEAQSLQKLATQKIASTVLAIIQGVDRTGRPTDLLTSLSYVADFLRKIEDTTGEIAVAAAAVQDLMDEIDLELKTAAAELTEKKNAAVEKAAAIWPTILTQHQVEATFDPSDALANISDWRRKKVRFENKQNRMGWDFETMGCAFIARVSGVPILAEFDDGLKTALKDMEDSLGLERKTQEFEDLIVEVDGKTKAQPIRWNHVKQKWEYLATEDAVRGRVVAFRCGPYVADLASGVRSIET